ncbi:PREDICTED: putative ribonuclease H protein At1g65750-like [Fragaria vesca subsp. vesca]
MHNLVQDLRIIKSFGAECRLGRAPRVIEVVWHPPVIRWVKINSDGAWKHAEGVGGFGAVFRDFKGHVLGAFSSNIDIPSSVAAEVMAIIVAIELAWVRDWKHIWLEVDSSLVLDYLRPVSFACTLASTCPLA